jgi:hypothetical protein
MSDDYQADLGAAFEAALGTKHEQRRKKGEVGG